MPLSQQPPPVTIAQEPLHIHSTHGSVGPVIAVLVMIVILAVVAVMIGRLCSGRRILGYGHHDMESWAETKCSSCIDGTIVVATSAPPPPPPPAQTHQETKQEEQSPQ